MIADSSGGMVNGASAGGITDSRPETHCTSTRSPDSMVITGGNRALNTPIRTVSGLARRVCVVMQKPSSCHQRRPARPRLCGLFERVADPQHHGIPERFADDLHA